MKKLSVFLAAGMLLTATAAFAQDAKPVVYTLGVTGAV